MRRLLHGVVLLVAMSAVGFGGLREASATAVPAGFVYRQGHELMLDGAVYHFVGFNAFGMTGCGNGTPWTRQQFDGYFSGLPPHSMTRTWAFQKWGTDALDTAVASAEAHGQKLIFSLAGAGGNTCETVVDKDVTWYQSGYQGDYLTWLRTVVTRYKDSPAIGMWEIMNEPGHNSTVDETTLKAFMDDAAATIKGIDAYHLVESGTMAEYAPGNSDFALLHSSPDIDVGSLHEYDYTSTNKLIISRHLAPTLHALYTQDKPLIIGEVGIPAGPGCPLSLADRSAALRSKFDAYLASGAGGVLVWNVTPRPVAASCDYSVSTYTDATTAPDPTAAMVGGYTQPAPVAPPVTSGRLVARHSGKCLDVTSMSTANHALLRQWDCTGGTNQTFTFQPTNDGFYELVAKHSGRCLDVTSASLNLKALIQQYDCWAGDNQQFRLEPTSGGYYHLIARNSVMCLDVSAHSTANGAAIQQYDCSTDPTGAWQSNQEFRIG